MDMEFINLVLQKIVLIAVDLLVPIALVALTAAGAKAFAYFKSLIPVKNLEYLTKLANQFVVAAEVASLTDDLMKLGIEKKAWVLAMIQSQLDLRGIKLDMAMVDAAIEKAWAEQFSDSRVFTAK